MGCAVLAARACMRSGVGLLTVHVPEKGVDVLQSAVPEAMTSIDYDGMLFANVPTDLSRYDAIAVGPGIGMGDRTYAALRTLVTEWGERPLVMDADALNIVAQHKELLSQLSDHTIVTPHAREYERLFGVSDPKDVAKENGLVIVRKGHHTKVYSPDGGIYENPTGNPGMATAGSGDVLTGVLLALLAQGMPLFEAACFGVFAHGKAGDIMVQKQSQASLTAGDIVKGLRYVGEKV